MVTTRWRRNPSALMRRTANVVVVRGPSATDAIALYGTAVALWSTFDDEVALSFDELVQCMAEQFDAEPSVVAADIADAWSTLQTVGAVVDAGH